MTGLTLYEGPSTLGPDPIVVLATGIRPSANVKTGDCYQVYILTADFHPHEARTLGMDESICGDCSLRPLTAKIKKSKDQCYVEGYMLNQPWTSWKNAPWKYPKGSLSQLPDYKPVRVGAYGDMAAVPNALQFWTEQLKRHKYLAYTSQWRHADLQGLAMASVQSPSEQSEAETRGYRTYRRYRGEVQLKSNEIICPFPRVQCRECMLCDGKNEYPRLQPEWKDIRKNIVVLDAGEKRRLARG